MKVSEAIGKLKIGDTVWVKLKADGFDDIGAPLKVASPMDCDYMWLHENAEISLTEPQAEKVEVPDFVAEWYETNKASIERAVSMQIQHGFTPLVEPRSKFDMWFFDESNHPIETLIRMKDGYTVKPKRWVVRQGGSEVWYLRGFGTNLDGEIIKRWSSHEGCVKFNDKSKAEAVAVLVEGSVEEV